VCPVLLTDKNACATANDLTLVKLSSIREACNRSRGKRVHLFCVGRLTTTADPDDSDGTGHRLALVQASRNAEVLAGPDDSVSRYVGTLDSRPVVSSSRLARVAARRLGRAAQRCRRDCGAQWWFLPCRWAQDKAGTR